MEIRIGDLAKRSGCEVVTIRYYEKEGLLPSQREAVATFGCTVRRTLSACNSSVIAVRST
jgi:hypothetical protein